MESYNNNQDLFICELLKKLQSIYPSSYMEKLPIQNQYEAFDELNSDNYICILSYVAQKIEQIMALEFSNNSVNADQYQDLIILITFIKNQIQFQIATCQKSLKNANRRNQGLSQQFQFEFMEFFVRFILNSKSQQLNSLIISQLTSIMESLIDFNPKLADQYLMKLSWYQQVWKVQLLTNSIQIITRLKYYLKLCLHPLIAIYLILIRVALNYFNLLRLAQDRYSN
ncbi:UNKNOWN [Stylonychia lemnae]|uniref:Uncharacterized protein n=1 Tax=Stylonychia lemnae TaxID=5949 RepID=A0A078B8C3_STYLE|nr:UNKNOWN [Stylonychia lemnae]|eukprot:CDW90441.1 UNKNOWN [Stylonychia lemnae]